MLDLSGDLLRLERADQRADQFIVAGIQGVQDGLGTLALQIQGGQEFGNGSAASILVDDIKAGIRSQDPEHSFIGIAQAGVVQLHGDVQTGILPSQMEQEIGLILLRFFQRQGLTGEDLAQG